MLRPVIDGEYWSGPDTITVEPQQSKNYELTYRPLTMTQEGKKHMVGIELNFTLGFKSFRNNQCYILLAPIKLPFQLTRYLRPIMYLRV